MRELSKSIARRMREPNFMRRYFVGYGVDIGGLPDPLTLYKEQFPLLRDVKIWDLSDGDAQKMAGVSDDTFDFVSSSHCLEHLHDPFEGLASWVRVCKPGGFIVVLVPDEDLYEQGVFPSSFNKDHKFTFTNFKVKSWSDKSVNVLDLVRSLGDAVALEKLEVLDSSYRFHLPRYDQTMTPIGEAAIEFILRKRHPSEQSTGARSRDGVQPEPALRRYYNQYRLDYSALKAGTAINKPFEDESEL